ncbi:unnamed protein product, partial [Polarella glacialis]
RGATICFHCRRRALRVPFVDTADLPEAEFEALVKVEDAEASVAAAVVLQTTGIDAAPIRLTTRYQELKKRGSGLRSVDKMFRRTVKSLNTRAEGGGYPGGYEERYRLDWAWRK